MAKCALRPLSELCADFKRQRGSDGSDSKDTALPDDLWEVPSDVPSENERDNGHMYNPRAAEAKPSRRTALSTLDKLRDKFKARQEERERTSLTNVPVGGDSQLKPPAASHTGTLTKLVERKGFGFIVPDVEGTGDVFLHCSELLGAGCGDMFVGMRVRYDVEVDSRSGKMRARTATILEAESSNAQAVEKRTAAAPEDRGSQDAAKKGKDAVQKRRASGSFTRGELLGAFRRLGRPYGKASKVGILSVRLPKVQGQPRWGYSDSGSDSGTSDDDSSWMEEDACLDDEDLIAKLEARLSRESGFDVMNEETFGESYSSGWSFEEAVAANAKLYSCHLSGVVELSMAAKDLEELGCGPTTAGGSADGAESSPMESPGGRSRADSPSEAEAIPQYILEGLQLQ